MTPENARARILKCVDKGLGSLGDIGKKVLYWHLTHTFGVSLDEVPDKPEKLSEALRRMYGAAATILESNIVKEIVSEFGLKTRPASLADAVKQARELLAKA